MRRGILWAGGGGEAVREGGFDDVDGVWVVVDGYVLEGDCCMDDSNSYILDSTSNIVNVEMDNDVVDSYTMDIESCILDVDIYL